MWLMIAFVLLLASIGFFLIALVSKIQDNGNAAKNVIRGVLFLILFVIAMSFDEAPESQKDEQDEIDLMVIQG